jgi:hypothetical protein
MKKANNKYRSVWAMLLTGSYLSFWVLLNLHHVISPEHHHARKVCHHTANEEHFHTEEYAEEGCDLCHFLMAPSELPALDLPFYATARLWPKQSEAVILSFSDNKTAFARPRAPPSV